MDGYTFRDFLPAIAILGPIIAAILTLFVTRRWQTRKQVTFFSGRTEDLIEQLREHRGELLTITSGGHELDAFNRAEVIIKNTGNTAIQNFSFEIVIPGEHQFTSGKVLSDNTQLKEAMDFDLGRRDGSASARAAIPFFNPAETFSVVVFFDGETVDCVVQCRVEDVRVRMRSGVNIDEYLDEYTPRSFGEAILRGVLRAMINR